MLDILGFQLILPIMSYRQLPLSAAGRIFYGPFPNERTLLDLKKRGVSVIWNLMAELQELFRIESKLFEHTINTPTDDYDVPETELFLNHLETMVAHLQAGRDVYIHCLGGHGRTGIAIAALARRLAAVGPGAALQFSLRHCQGPEHENQKKFVSNLRFAKDKENL